MNDPYESGSDLTPETKRAPSRPRFLTRAAAAGSVAAALPIAPMAKETSPASPSGDAAVKRPKVIFLDVNETLLDLAPLKISVSEALGGREDLVPMWFTTMLQYSLVVTVADQYQNFGEIGASTLRMMAADEGIDLSPKAAKEAIKPILSLAPHPDVRRGLQQLSLAGIELVTLTNGTIDAVESQMINSGLDEFLTDRLSIEELGLYKPHPHVYRWAARKLGVPIGDCMLVAAHGWDIAGALWSGMRAAFITRPGARLYPDAPAPEFQASDLAKTARLILDLPR